MNNRLLVPRKTPGLLDLVPGAAAAYSLRSLSNSYSGPVVTVRRSTDDAEADFTASEVSDGTLAAWCGGGDGFVKTWHDQSQNGRDATQATTTAQPQIVDSGVLVTEGGKAAVRFDGADDVLDCGTAIMAATGPVSIFLAAAGVAGSSGIGLVSQYRLGEAGRCLVGYTSTAGGVGYYWFCNGSESLNLYTYYIADNENTVVSIVMPSQNTGYIYANSANYDEDTAVNANRYQTNTEISNAVVPFDGTISELLIYPTDQTALRTRIEGNLAWYY